jgi:PleD family two-component response regulator
MSVLLMMYELSDNKNIKDSRYYDTSDRFTLESKNADHTAGTINNGASAGRILIVDDDPDITLSFSIGLEDDGFEVDAYNDPLDALLDFKPSFYDLLLDINMPKMNGFELCTKILEIDLNVKICFITAGGHKYRWTKGSVSCIKYRMLH